MNIKNTHAAPALMIAVFAFLALSQLIDPTLLGMRENPYLSVIILQFLIFALPSVFFCKLRSTGETETTRNKYRSRLRLSMFTGDHILFVIFSVFVLILTSAAMKVGLSYLFPNALVASASRTYPDSIYLPDGVFQALYTVLAFGLLPAVTEEFLFRSILVAEYEKNGVACAMIMSALMFAMIHFNIVMLPVYFVSGLLLAFVLYATRSVFAAMTVHFVNNIFNLYFESYIWKIISRPQNTVIFLFILFVLLFVFIILMLAEAERIYHNYGVLNKSSAYSPKKNRDKKKKDGASPFAAAFLSPPFLLLVVFFVIASAFL